MTELCWMLSMTKKEDAISMAPSLLDIVALLTSLPENRLARGQAGTIVEPLDEEKVLVEFQRRSRTRVRYRALSSVVTSGPA
jgi:hypothetical protein